MILVENIRYFKEEMNNDESFSKSWLRLAIFILMMRLLVLIENNLQYIKLQNL